MTEHDPRRAALTGRRGREESERDQSNAEAIAAGVSVAVGSMILGVLSSHGARAADESRHQVLLHDGHDKASGRESGPVHLEEGQGGQGSANDPHVSDAALGNVQLHQSGQVHSPAAPEGTALQHGLSSTEVSHSTAGEENVPGTTEGGTTATELGTGHAHGILDRGGSEPSDMAPNWLSDASHGFVGIGSVIAETVHGLTASVVHSLDTTIQAVSSAISGLAETVSALTHPVDALLHGVGDLLQDHSGATGTADPGGLLQPLAVLDHLAPASTPSGHGSGLLNDVSGTILTHDIHIDVAGYGDGSPPIHIGFVGQSLAHTPDVHDVSTHAIGTTLHGFV